ncbi:MAG TPA: NAD-dependent DNA ligase LigA [Saprospiraceae bacterium]|nr:NAD-dependent DNA ligase LigA [Saprospiraceae bacterium]HMQ85344.1 NAD-dependent DNA ligase LigA [Saprospiraceae bacterium]
MYTQEEQKNWFDLSKNYLAGQAQVQTPQEQAAQLRPLLQFHEYRYYILNDPLISDYEYDQLYKMLEAIELAHPELIVPDSPTQRVSNDLIGDFQAVAHLTPMLSLDNSYNAEDLIEFDAQIKRFAKLPEDQDIVYAVEPKFDGGSIALVYENDLLTRAATRGNGTIGEEITHNARVIRSIPLKADFSRLGIQRAELRGEVIIRKDMFEKMNRQREEDDLPLYANARNTATGGLRIKDPKEVAGRGLEAFVYTFGFAQKETGEDALGNFETHYQSLDVLATLGFKVPAADIERKRCRNIREVVAFCESWQEKREAYPYEIDGMVVKVDSRALQERVGFTSHHPRWAIAFKFKAKQATTKLLQVDYQVGKIGSITPVAKVEPVQLAGVTVSSISLHNEDFIKGKDLRLNDTVLIERAGDVIPYVVKAMDELRDGTEVPIEFPRYCPINDTNQPVELIRAAGEAAWRCPVCVCGAQNLQKLIFHVSKDAMDIEGLGKSIIERFFDLGWLRTLADVYRLDYDKIAQLEGFGEKSANNIRASVDKAKQNPIHRLLHSLSIHHLGKKVSQLLAANVQHVLDLQRWTLDEFTHIKDVGPVVSENIIRFFADERNVALLKDMEALGVNMQQTDEDRPKAERGEGPFAGKSILFTGTLQKMGRKEAQEKAEAAGARNISAISSKLDILVVGENAGSKLKKAQELGTVQILTEAEFLDLITG